MLISWVLESEKDERNEQKRLNRNENSRDKENMKLLIMQQRTFPLIKKREREGKEKRIKEKLGKGMKKS